MRVPLGWKCARLGSLFGGSSGIDMTTRDDGANQAIQYLACSTSAGPCLYAATCSILLKHVEVCKAKVERGMRSRVDRARHGFKLSPHDAGQK